MSGVLVHMRKDGITQEVHPSCVADHQRVGWTLAPAPAPEPQPPATGKRPRKAPSTTEPTDTPASAPSAA